MACFDENTVIAFFASPRASDVARRVDAHAADCTACRQLLAAYAAMSPAEDPPASSVDGAIALTAGVPALADDSLGRRLAHAQAARRVGEWIGGKWRVDRLLGVGGMAQVFAATHRNGKPVAVKVMRPELAVEPALVARFLREAYAANRVAHPGAVAVHDDAKTEDGVPFLVMDLLEGRTLRERLDREGPLGAADAVRVGEQVLDVLAAAHEKGIVHRDIKPENLFETTAGAVRVLDFGIARLTEPGQGMTHSGMTMGTVGYMPPEQARGQMAAVDARSDVWAVGATLFTLLTGRGVHEAATHNEVLLLAMTAKVAPVRSSAPAIPPAVARVLDKALAFDKTSRWDDARAMQRVLRDALDAPEANATGARNPRRAMILAGSAIAAAGLVALVAWSSSSSRADRSPPRAEVPIENAASPAPASSLAATPSGASPQDTPPAPSSSPPTAGALRPSARVVAAQVAIKTPTPRPRPSAAKGAAAASASVPAPASLPVAAPTPTPAAPSAMNPLGPRT